METPFFSIIIAVLNGEASIGKTLQSVETQSFSNFEIIVIDGGSTDKTLQIVSKFHRVSYCISEPDKGIYDAMNKGVTAAKGSWIYFLGSDDYFFNDNVLDAVAASLEKCNCDFFYGNVSIENKIYDGFFNLEKLLRTNISHQAIFYNRQVFDRVGNFNLRYKTHADWDFNVRCFLNQEIRVEYKNLIIAVFTFGGASSSHDILCLREVILPERTRMFSESLRLNNLKIYDEWWRLLRNSHIRTTKELKELLPHKKIPSSLKAMVRFQSIIPHKLLKVGTVSKILMFKSYCFNQIQTLLKWT